MRGGVPLLTGGRNPPPSYIRIIADVSGDDRIKRRSYTHLRHVLPLCTPAPSGAKPFAVLSARSARPDKARRMWRAPNSINCFEDTRRSRERFASSEKRRTGRLYAHIYISRARRYIVSYTSAYV